ncbi:MAG: nucleoside phosphorylase [Candidatus Thermoplasmatota archaeon]|nr:nucleoside phosphorylase [Candidatus Thermoplasmatota archaeon]
MKIKSEVYPILEFDPDKTSVTNPETLRYSFKVPENCVLCFFNDVLLSLYKKGVTKIIGNATSSMGRFPIYETEFNGRKIALFNPGVGAPLAAAFLEEIISLGGRKFIACGGAGVLDKKISAGHLLVPTSAIRDEGTSYHYLPPGREIGANPSALRTLTNTLTKHNIKYLLTKTWTTDAFYRETKEKVKLRQSEGCLTVEMEASALFAVAEFRGVSLAELLYAADDVSDDIWDIRSTKEREITKQDVVNLSIEACSML